MFTKVASISRSHIDDYVRTLPPSCRPRSSPILRFIKDSSKFQVRREMQKVYYQLMAMRWNIIVVRLSPAYCKRVGVDPGRKSINGVREQRTGGVA